METHDVVNFLLKKGFQVTPEAAEFLKNMTRLEFQDLAKIIIRDKNRKNDDNFKWWEWYEKHGKKWYWIGPEIGKNFKSNQIYKSGTYFIRVYNNSNIGKYVLAVGDIESFPISVIARMIFTMPKINSSFWDNVKCLKGQENG